MALGPVVANMETNSRAAEFVQVARYIMLAHKMGARAADLAAQGRATERVQRILKAAVSAGSTSGWGAELADYSSVVSAFLETLRNVGAFDTLMPAMRRVPMRTRIDMVTAGATAATVPEGSVTQISSLSVSGGTSDPFKVLAIVAATQELLRFAASGSGDLFARELRGAVALETDEQFLAVLLDGVSPIASAGASVQDIGTDFKNLFDAIPTGSASKLFTITTPTICKAWSTKVDAGTAAFPNMTPQGGVMFGTPVVCSDAVSSGQIIVVDADRIAASPGELQIDIARHADLQLNTTPDSPPTASTVSINLWQRGLVALKAFRYFQAERLSSSSVAVITGATYSANSPAD